MPKWRIRILEAKIPLQTAALRQNGVDHRCVRDRHSALQRKAGGLTIFLLAAVADMDGEEETAVPLAQEEATGDPSSAQGAHKGKGKNPPPPRSKRCGNCNDKLPQDHVKPFCYRCIQKLSSKETSQFMGDFLAVQSEMLSTLQSIKTAIAPKADYRKILSSREGTSSQEGISRQGSENLADTPFLCHLGVEEFEDPEESEEHSLEEGEDTD
ncbi:hypothetical protein AB205_0107960 [Aquarana catesbeiana]|uniref:Uncharacterized protein n=1 Tax=Aquarana catesbeiana TaxID=8400 RepID=A0A2G9RNS6_AQUCT|nr:hypothetical protein AB205_0107960 [Aquarana catesbeiana]